MPPTTKTKPTTSDAVQCKAERTASTSRFNLTALLHRSPEVLLVRVTHRIKCQHQQNTEAQCPSLKH